VAVDAAGPEPEFEPAVVVIVFADELAVAEILFAAVVALVVGVV
jgi:hypothetical protein